MSQVLAGAAVLAWTLGGFASLAALWLWLRTGRHGLRLFALALLFCGQLVVLGLAVTGGVEPILDRRPGEGLAPWFGWVVGVAGLVSLGSALRSRGGSEGPLRDPDRAGEFAVGFFGLGFLLRELAILL